MKSRVVITVLVLIAVLVLVASDPPKRGRRKNSEASFPAKVKKTKQTRVGKLIKTEGGIEGSYVVLFKDKASLSAKKRNLKKSGRKLRSMKKIRGISIDKVTKSDLEKLEKDPDVLLIEQEQVYNVSACHCSEYDASVMWNLDRLDTATRYFDGKLTIDDVEQGDRPFVYVLDTGISDTHPDFMGKAKQEYSVFSNQESDGNGHGTHVAGTVGSHHYGVAQDVKLRGIKVLDNNGGGTTVGVIQGIEYVIEQHLAREQPRKSIINMSLVGPWSEAMNSAVKAATDTGIIVVVAAGNANQVIDVWSPASSPEAITVAASDPWDYFTSWSNFGAGVDIIAPGSWIESTWSVTCNNPPPTHEVPDLSHPCMVRTTLAGTSMAAPHVAGAIAAYMNTFDYEKSPAEIRQWLKTNAAKHVIRNVPSDTPNYFLQVNKCA